LVNNNKANIAPVVGTFKLFRKNQSEETWEEIEDLVVNTNLAQSAKLNIYDDKTTQQGVLYQYALARYSGTLYA
jgi:hypothetical protein